KVRITNNSELLSKVFNIMENLAKENNLYEEIVFTFFLECLFQKEEETKPTNVLTPEQQAEVDAIRKQTREAALVSEVVNMGLHVENLSVDLQGDTAIVYGQVDTQADKEKVILTVGNVDGVASVDDRLEVANPEEDSQFHEVQKGDSLSKIAKHYYGDAMKYPIIFEANKPMLKDPDLIYPGQMLRIPPIA
ncbi:MAG TPA: peptidoglycan-binding protein LysM, partial [Saprospiraceae bacterium]|nr:peptidoglycan-binding protein LysM [Saprospiraceae bacterium]